MDLPDCRISAFIPFQLSYQCRIFIFMLRFRNKYKISKSSACRHFPDGFKIILHCAEIPYRKHTAEGIFIIVPDCRSIFCMNLLQRFRHCPFVHIQCRVQERFRFPLEGSPFIPSVLLYSLGKFTAYFFIRDKCILLSQVVSKIPQMDQQHQHIIFVSECYHIVLESSRLDSHAATGQHNQNIVFRPLKSILISGCIDSYAPVSDQ